MGDALATYSRKSDLPVVLGPLHLRRLLSALDERSGACLVRAGVFGSPVSSTQEWRLWDPLNCSSDDPLAVSWWAGDYHCARPLGLVGTLFAVRVDRELPPFLPHGRGQDALFGYQLGRVGGREARLRWIVEHDRSTPHPIVRVRWGALGIAETLTLLLTGAPAARRTTRELGEWLRTIGATWGARRMDDALRRLYTQRWRDRLARATVLPHGPHREELVAAYRAALEDERAHLPFELRHLGPGSGAIGSEVERFGAQCIVWDTLWSHLRALDPAVRRALVFDRA